MPERHATGRSAGPVPVHEVSMRLTCPNCKAQYEVEDSVIPPAGRDVQCSSCGTTWFQYPAGVALQMRASDLDDDDDDEPGRPAEPRPQPAAAERRIDRTVLDVLRQEAERELSERQRNRPEVETQADLGLVTRPRARPGEPGARPAAPAAAAAGDPPAGPQPRKDSQGDNPVSRRGRLPDIDELSSTLEPRRSPPPPPDETSEAEGVGGRDFRRGLSAVIVIVGVLAALYLFAPQLSELVPALAGPLSGFVALVDSLRHSVAGLLGAN